MVNGTTELHLESHGQNLINCDISVKCRASLRFRKNKSQINSIGPHDWFYWYFKYWLERRSLDDERQIARWKRSISRFNGRFSDYTILPKIRQFYCTRVMNQLKVIYFIARIKMSYYWFNRKELLQKAKDRYHNCEGNEKAADYYLENRGVLKEKAKSKYKNLSEDKKEVKREFGKNRYENTKENAS